MTAFAISPPRAALTAALLFTALIPLTACTTRPFQPMPPEHAVWAKAGVNEDGIRRAMLDCGFPHTGHVDRSTITTNDYAAAQRCMIGHGFRYQDRRIVCADSPDLPACASVPRGKTFGTDPDFDPALAARRPAQPPAFTYWSRPGTDTEDVRRAMSACGYTALERPFDMMLSNDLAAAELCMIDRQFTYALSANQLTCKQTPALPACRGRVIDTHRCCAAPKPVTQR